MKWRSSPPVLCNRKISIKLKRKNIEVARRLVMHYDIDIGLIRSNMFIQ